MGAYVYQDRNLRINRYRRKGDGAPYEPDSIESCNDRRRKLKDGIILINFDRRQNHGLEYNGSDKRKGIDRRRSFDRRISSDRKIVINRRRYAY